MTRLSLALLGIALGMLPVGGRAASPDCQAPAELIEDDPRLLDLARQIQDKRPITIVAIGGASTAGRASGNADEYAYPHRLQEALRRRHPGVPITVVNKGMPRQSAQDMVERFARDVYPLSPDLVVWETGTFDAARGLDLDTFATALDAGIKELRDHKLEVMLINMQYSRMTASVIDFEPYLDTMQRTADIDDAYLFRRFEIMRYWSENDVFDFVDVPKGRRAEFARQVYECLAERLADAIDYAARPSE